MKQEKDEKINNKPNKKRFKKELILPLYFGWELVLRKVYDLKKHIVGPFKEYWQYITVVFLLIIVVSTGLILINKNFTALGATYGWVQSTWSEGASTTAVATHTDNQTNWTKYYSKDDNVSTSSDQLTLSSGSASVEQTLSDDFDDGTLNESGSFFVDIDGDEIKMFLCGTDSVTYSSIVYPTVLIGTQCWLAKNLNVGTRINGAGNQTDNSTLEKYCYSDNESNCTTYGGLYQWDEMMQYVTTSGTKGICPTGWHIPTDAQQHTLDDFLDTSTCLADREDWGCDPAGGKLKETGTTHWTTPNTGATNSSGFTALPAGFRSTDGTFYGLGTGAYFWSSSESGTSAWRRVLDCTYSTVYRYASDQAYGFSVRCLKD